MLLAIFTDMCRDMICYKRFKNLEHVQNWCNKYYSDRKLEFVTEDYFEESTGYGKWPGLFLSSNKIFLMDCGIINPSKIIEKKVSYNFKQ